MPSLQFIKRWVGGWGQEVNNKEESDLCGGVVHSKMRPLACVAAALGGQTQEEAADEAAGQDDVPLDEVGGLRRSGKGRRERVRALKPEFCLYHVWVQAASKMYLSLYNMSPLVGVVLLTAH